MSATSPAGLNVDRNGSPHPERISERIANIEIKRHFASLFIAKSYPSFAK
jgi:hypothetical protein